MPVPSGRACRRPLSGSGAKTDPNGDSQNTLEFWDIILESWTPVEVHRLYNWAEEVEKMVAGTKPYDQEDDGA